MTKVLLPLASLMLLMTNVCSAEVTAARQTELMYLLKQDCGSCHGMTLKGGLGPALLPETLAGKPEQLLVAAILDGREGTAMPGWKTMLNQDDATWLTRQLQRGVQ